MIGLMRVTNLTKWGESVINLHKLDEFNTVSPLFNENLIPVFSQKPMDKVNDLRKKI